MNYYLTYMFLSCLCITISRCLKNLLNCLRGKLQRELAMFLYCNFTILALKRKKNCNKLFPFQKTMSPFNKFLQNKKKTNVVEDCSHGQAISKNTCWWLIFQITKPLDNFWTLRNRYFVWERMCIIVISFAK